MVPKPEQAMRRLLGAFSEVARRYLWKPADTGPDEAAWQ
jgi:hypothetical protein